MMTYNTSDACKGPIMTLPIQITGQCTDLTNKHYTGMNTVKLV